MYRFFGALILTFAITASLYSQGTITDRATGQSFPDQITIDQNGKSYDLKATGVATRKKFFAKVYSIASYMENPTASFNAILDDNQAKQLTLKWVRNVSANKVRDAYREGFQRTAGRNMNQLRGDVDTFIGIFNQSVRNGEEHILRWFPDGQVDILVDGNLKGSINNPAFGEALWEIWFGNRGPVDRNQLVSYVR